MKCLYSFKFFLLLCPLCSWAGFWVRKPTRPALTYTSASRVFVRISQQHERYHHRGTQLSVSYPGSESKGKEPQSAFLALLELSSMLGSTRNYASENLGGGVSARENWDGSLTLRQLAPSPRDGDNSNLSGPAIQLSIGASKAFRAIDRNLMRAVSELDDLNESLRKLASEQSEFLSKFLKMPESAAPESRQAVIDRSIIAVREMASMDQRLNRALSDLYEVSSSFKIVESNNSELISRLAEGAVTSPENVQEQALSTSKAFEQIDGRLSRALSEVRALGSSFKTLESKAERSRVSASYGNPQGASHQSIAQQQSTVVPFSLLPSASPLFALADTNMDAPYQMQETITTSSDQASSDQTYKFESALQTSIAAAEAFSRMDHVMVNNDSKILHTLKDLQSSLQKLISQTASNYDAKIQNPPGAVTSYQRPPASKSPEARVTEVGKASAPSLYSRDSIGRLEDSYRNKAKELSEAAARAFETMNANMSRNNQEACVVLQDLSASFRKLASSEGYLINRLTKQLSNDSEGAKGGHGSNAQPSPTKPTSPGTAPSFTATSIATSAPDPASLSQPHDTVRSGILDDDVWTGALRLSEAAAQAFNEINEMMLDNDDVVIAQLEELRSSFAKLALSETILPPPSAESNAHISHKVPTASAGSPIKRQLAEPRTTTRDEMMREKAMRLSAEASRAFNEIDGYNSRYGSVAIALLEEIDASFKELVKRDISCSQISRLVEPELQPEPEPENKVMRTDTEALPQAQPTLTTKASPASSTFPIRGQPRVSQIDSLAQKKASELSDGAAHAFNQMNTMMNRNYDNTNSLLEEISRSFAKMAELEAGLSSVFGMKYEVTRHIEQSNPMRQDAIETATEMESTSNVGESVGGTPLARAKALSIEAAQAFEDLDKTMASNDLKTIALLNQIKSSFEKLRALDNDLPSPHISSTDSSISHRPEETSSAFFWTESGRHEPQAESHGSSTNDGSYPNPSLSLGPSTSVSSMSQSLAQSPAEAGTERDLKKARDLSRDAADAFKQLDMSMGGHDRDMIAILKEIDASFAKLVNVNKELSFMLKGEEETAESMPHRNPVSVDESLPKETRTTYAPMSESPESRAYSDDFEAPTRERARKLSIAAARAFGNVNTRMASHSEQTIALLGEINDSFKKLKILGDKVPVMQTEGGRSPFAGNQAEAVSGSFYGSSRVSESSTVSKSSAEARPEPQLRSAHDRTMQQKMPFDCYNDGRQLPSLHMESLASSESESTIQLSKEIASAFDKFGEDMNNSDQVALGLLDEIKASFRYLAEISESCGTTPDEASAHQQSPDTIIKYDDVGGQQVSPSRTGADVSPIKSSTENDSLLIQRALQLSKDAAAALEEMNDVMIGNDRLTIEVLKEIRKSFKTLAGSDSPIASNLGYQYGQPESTKAPDTLVSESPKASISTTKNLISTAEEDAAKAQHLILEKALQLSKNAAFALDNLTKNMSVNDDVSLGVLREISTSFRKLSTAKGLLDGSRSLSESAEPFTYHREFLPTQEDTSSAPHQPEATKFQFESLAKSNSEARAWDRALSLSNEAARLFDGINDSLTRNGRSTMDVLDDIKRTLQRIEENRNNFGGCKSVEQQAPAPEKSKARTASASTAIDTIVGTFPSAPMSSVGSSFMSVDVSSTFGFRADEGKLSTLEKAKQLSIESANALEELTATMTLNDGVMLAELQKLKASFRTLASESHDNYSSSEKLERSAKEGQISPSPLGMPNAQEGQSSVSFTRASSSSQHDNDWSSYRSGGRESLRANATERISIDASPAGTLVKRETTKVSNKETKNGEITSQEEGSIPELVWSFSSPSDQLSPETIPQDVQPTQYSLKSATSEEITMQQRTAATVEVIEVMGGNLVTRLEARLSLLNELDAGFKELVKDQ